MRQVKRLFSTVLTAIGLVALAGCASVVPKGPAVSVAPPEVRTAPPVSNNLPVDTNRHRVALLVPLTGADAIMGQSIANAANLAVLNTGGTALRVTTYDTGAGAETAAQKALADGNRLILGPLRSDDVRSVAPLARSAHVPVVSFSNDALVAGNGVYLMGFTPTQSITRVVNYAHDHGVNAFAGLAPRGLYGERVSTAFLRAVERAGGQVVAMQNYDHNPATQKAAIAKLASTPAFDAIMIGDFEREAAVIAPILHRSPASKARILGTELWGRDYASTQRASLIGAWYASVSDALFIQLAQKYRARFGKAPTRAASLGYDSVLLATKIARDWETDQPFPQNKLSDKGGFDGIDGIFRFSRDGIAERGLQVNQITSTGVKIISPAPSSFGN